MGEGTGTKDVSDQIQNEDQLLGAQQKGAEKEEQQDKPQGPEDQDKVGGSSCLGTWRAVLCLMQ